MSFRTEWSKKRNHSNTLPIEDWVRGAGNLLSRRKSTSSKANRLIAVPYSPVSPPPVPPMSYTVAVSSGTSPQIPQRSPTRSSTSSHRHPVKQWIRNIPDGEHSPEFQMVPAPLSIDRSSPTSTPIIPPSPRTDWGSSIAGSEPDSSGLLYKNRLENLIDASSRINVVEKTNTRSVPDVSPISSRRASSDGLGSCPAELHLSNDLSKEYLNDEPLDEALLPAHLRGESTDVSLISGSVHGGSVHSWRENLSQEDRQLLDLTAAMLGLPAPSFGSQSATSTPERRLSSALSDSSYYTADVSDVEAKSSTSDLSLIQAPMPGAYLPDEDIIPKSAPPIAPPPRSLARRPTAKHNAVATTAEPPVPMLPSTVSEIITAASYDVAPLTEPPASQTPGGEAKSENLIVSVQPLQDTIEVPVTRIDTADHHQSGDLQSVGSASEGNVSPTESASDAVSGSLSSMSIKMARQVRPTRHYRMTNGVITEFNPWSAGNTFDLSRYSPPPSEGSEGEADISSMSEGSFFAASGKHQSWVAQQQPTQTIV